MSAQSSYFQSATPGIGCSEDAGWLSEPSRPSPGPQEFSTRKPVGGVADDDERVVLAVERAAAGVRRRHDDAAVLAHRLRRPPVVQRGRDEDGAGLVQRGVVGVEVGPQPVVGAEGDLLRLLRPLHVELAGFGPSGLYGQILSLQTP